MTSRVLKGTLSCEVITHPSSTSKYVIFSFFFLNRSQFVFLLVKFSKYLIVLFPYLYLFYFISISFVYIFILFLSHLYIFYFIFISFVYIFILFLSHLYLIIIIIFLFVKQQHSPLVRKIGNSLAFSRLFSHFFGL
jgi:pilus assembly protein TadC